MTNLQVTLSHRSSILSYNNSTLKAFQSFGQVDILTGGGPNNATNFLVYSIYKTAFSSYRFDYASAQGVILLIIIILIMLFKSKLEKKVHYQ
ncbi:MAG: hypothetical protein ACLTQH_02685 [Fusobacterium sp.]